LSVFIFPDEFNREGPSKRCRKVAAPDIDIDLSLGLARVFGERRGGAGKDRESHCGCVTKTKKTKMTERLGERVRFGKAQQNHIKATIDVDGQAVSHFVFSQ